MFHMQLSKLVGVAQAAKKDGSLAAGKPSAKTMSMMERCEKPALWYRMERLKRHGLALAAVQTDGMDLRLQNKLWSLNQSSKMNGLGKSWSRMSRAIRTCLAICGSGSCGFGLGQLSRQWRCANLCMVGAMLCGTRT